MPQLIIYYNGKWSANTYVGAKKLGAVIGKNATFAGLVDLIYAVTKIDRTKFDLDINYLVPCGINEELEKIMIEDDHSVRFLTYNPIVIQRIYIDTIVRDLQCNENEENTDNVGNDEDEDEDEDDDG